MAERRKTQEELMEDYSAKVAAYRAPPARISQTELMSQMQAAAQKMGGEPVKKTEAQWREEMNASAIQTGRPPTQKTQSELMANMKEEADGQMSDQPARPPARLGHRLPVRTPMNQAKRQASQSELIAAMKSQVGDDSVLPAMNVPRVASRPGRLANFVERFDHDIDTSGIVNKLAAKDVPTPERLAHEQNVIDRNARKEMREKLAEERAGRSREDLHGDFASQPYLRTQQSSGSLAKNRGLRTQASHGSFGFGLQSSDSFGSPSYNGRLKPQASQASLGTSLYNVQSYGSYGSTTNLIPRQLPVQPVVSKRRLFSGLGSVSSGVLEFRSCSYQGAAVQGPTIPPPSVPAQIRLAPRVPASNLPATNATARHITSTTPAVSGVRLEPLTRFERIRLDILFFKLRYLNLIFAILSFIDLIVAIVHSVRQLTAHRASHAGLADANAAAAGMIAGIWLTVAFFAFIGFTALYIRMALQDIKYKWPYVIEKAFVYSTRCFRRKRREDLENQVGDVHPIALQDIPAVPTVPTANQASARNTAPLAAGNQVSPLTPQASANNAPPVTPQSRRLAEFVFPFSPRQQRKDADDEGVEMTA